MDNNSSYHVSESNRNYAARTIRRAKSIEDCISSEDVQYQLTYEQQRIIQAVEKNKKEIKNAITTANGAINTAWLNSYERIIKVSTNLDSNLNYHARKNLETSKFQYYTGLWFRSMLAADIVHKEFQEIDTSFREINSLILSVKNGKHVGIQKKIIYESKDNIKELRGIFLTRLQGMNRNTATLRDKIGQECGERGRQWRDERMRNRS